jgi:hypothetical protein
MVFMLRVGNMVVMFLFTHRIYESTQSPFPLILCTLIYEFDWYYSNGYFLNYVLFNNILKYLKT